MSRKSRFTAEGEKSEIGLEGEVILRFGARYLQMLDHADARF